eukprot:7905900-Karenia_brevis.AAC.1
MGVARFKTSEAMWQYMKQEVALDHDGRDIFRFADKARPDNPMDAEREKAVRKVVRTIIECSGGNGRDVKKHIEADYKVGFVLWKEAEVAEWNSTEKTMQLKGELLQHRGHF